MSIKSRAKAAVAPDRRKLTGKIWLGVSVFYDLIRASIVTLLFSEYGVNGWVYLAYSLIFSVIFGIVSFRFVIAAVDKNVRNAWLYGSLTALTFFAPDAYIIIVGKGVPTSTYVLLALYLTASTSLMIVELTKKVRSRRRQAKTTTQDKPPTER